MNVELALITLAIIVPLLTGSVAVVPVARPSAATSACATASPPCLTDVSESLPGVRVVAAFNRQRHNVLHHRNVVGEYRDRQRLHGAHRRPCSGRSTEFIGIIGQAMLLLIGGAMVRDGELTIGELTAFILYLNAFFQPIQQLVQQYNLYQQGQAAIVKLNDLLATAPDGRGGAPTRAAAADRGRDRLRRRVVRVRPGDAGAPRRRPAHPGRARRSSFVGPTGARQVDDRQARHALLRPDRGTRAASTGTTCATSRSSRCAASSASCRRSRSCSPGTVRDNIAFARPDATDDEVEEAVDAGRADRARRAPARRARHARARARACRCRPASASSSRWRAPSSPDPRVLVLDEATSNLDLKSETAGRGGPRRAARGPHRDHRRPPPVDGDAGRSDRGRRRRPDRRARLARRSSPNGRYADLYTDVVVAHGAIGGLSEWDEPSHDVMDS